MSFYLHRILTVAMNIYIYFLEEFSLNIFTFYSISSNIIFLLKKSKKEKKKIKEAEKYFPQHIYDIKNWLFCIYLVFLNFLLRAIFFFDFLSLLALNKHKRVLFLLSMQIGTIGNMNVWYFLWLSLGSFIILEWDFLIFSLYTTPWSVSMVIPTCVLSCLIGNGVISPSVYTKIIISQFRYI